MPDAVRTQRALALLKRATHQWLDGADDRQPRPVFVFGPEGAGAPLLAQQLDQPPAVWRWSPGRHLAHAGGRLRAPEVVAGLTAASPAEVVIFEAVEDSHLADRVLDAHPGAVALWVTRGWASVAKEEAARHGTRPAERVRALATGRAHEVGAFGERLPDGLRGQLAELVGPDLSPEAGAALAWYVRASFFHALGLDGDARVRLVRHEDVVEAPERTFGGVLTHLGLPLEAVEPPEAGAAQLPPEVDVPAPVARLCNALQALLDETAGAQG